MTFQHEGCVFFPSFYFMFSAGMFFLSLRVTCRMVDVIMYFWCIFTFNIVPDFSINFNHMSNIVFIFFGSCFSFGWRNVSSCFV